MKKALLFALLLTGTFLAAQTVQEFHRRPVFTPFAPAQSFPSLRTTTPCGPDTVEYPYGKATAIRLLSVNSSQSCQAIAQYFEAPQSITLTGVDFYGLTPGAVTPHDVYLQVFNAGPDSLPLGSPLHTETYSLDSSNGNGTYTLASLKRSVTFSNPVTVNGPYLLVFSNPSSVSVSVVTNDWDTVGGSADGRNEWLLSADFRNQPGGLWTRGYNVNSNGIPINADILLHPHTNYQLLCGFRADTTCFTAPDTVRFDEMCSPVLASRMYNYAVFVNQGYLCWRYDFGDGSPSVYGRDTFHVYNGSGPYNATLYATLSGWNYYCTPTYTVPILGSGRPTAYWNYTTTGFSAMFTDVSSGAYSWAWNFGDGSPVSTQRNPTHSYTANGSYPVFLIVENPCGSDTFLDTVIINCMAQPITAGFTRVQNGFSVTFTSTSANATSWFWDFGDGQTSTVQNPIHIYANIGTYWVTHSAYNLCYGDTTGDSVFAGFVYLTPGISNDFSLWPNPTTGEITLQFALPASDNTILAITDLRGRVLQVVKVQPAATSFRTDLRDLPPGIYLAELRTGSHRTVKRVVRD